MSWGCRACAARRGLPFDGRNGFSRYGRCGLGNHDVAERIEYFTEDQLDMAVSPVTSEPAHYPLGPSRFRRIMECPGSVELSAALPEPASSSAADEGTRLHDLLALCLTNGEVDARSYAACWLAGEDTAKVRPLNREQCDAVTTILDYVWPLMSGHKDAKLLVEHKFKMADIHPDFGGTADVVVWLPSVATLHVIDAKFGRGVTVEVDGEGPAGDQPNAQLVSYGLGAVRAIDGIVPDQIVVTVAQPRISHEAGPIRSLTLDLFGLMDFEAQARDAIAAAGKPGAALVAGDHCKFCPGQIMGSSGKFPCPAYQARNEAALASAFDIVPTATQEYRDTPATLNAADLVARLAEVPVLERYIDELQRVAKDRATTEQLPGYCWTNGARNWKWTADPATVLDTVDALVGAAARNKLSRLATPIEAEKVLSKEGFAAISEMVQKDQHVPKFSKDKNQKGKMSLEQLAAWRAANTSTPFDTVSSPE